MPVSREQFDADQDAQNQATTDYITAVDAYIELTKNPDFSFEDAKTQAALQAVNDAKGRIPQPPPGP